MAAVPSTVGRVPEHTANRINRKIQRATAENVGRVAAEGIDAIDRRLWELNREWDIERALEANASTAVLAGCLLGLAVNRKFFLLPTVVAGFLLQHAIQGWCPPLGLFRRLGIRTQAEIEFERYALMAIRDELT